MKKHINKYETTDMQTKYKIFRMQIIYSLIDED